MKKVINALIVVTMAVAIIFMMTACNKNNNPTTTEITTGPVYKVEKDDDGKEYAILEKYTISDEDAKKIAEGDYEDLMIKDFTVNFYNEIPVKEIASGAFSNQLALESLIIGENVEKIGSACLAGCTNLKELTIPFVGGVKEDAKNAEKTLAYLFGTTEVSDATSVTVSYNESSTATYYIPNSLQKVTLTGDTVTDYAFYGMTCKEVVLSGGVASIGCFSFANMPNLRTIDIPLTVTEIKKSAFSGCTSLYKVNFPDESALSVIWQEAFKGCKNLNMDGSTLVLPDPLTKLYYSAFEGCSSLKAVNLANTSITEVPEKCFRDCTSLKEITVLSTVTFGPYAYGEDVVIKK